MEGRLQQGPAAQLPGQSHPRGVCRSSITERGDPRQHHQRGSPRIAGPTLGGRSDEFTRECHTIEVEHSITAKDVITTLDSLFRVHGERSLSETITGLNSSLS